MQLFFEQLLNGIAMGSIYALITLGLALVYGILRILHVAHAAVYTVGAYAGLFCYSHTGSLLAAFLVGMVIVLMLLGIPVAFAFLTANFIGAMIFMGGLDAMPQIVVNAVESVTVFALIPVPLFIITARLVGFTNAPPPVAITRPSRALNSSHSAASICRNAPSPSSAKMR